MRTMRILTLSVMALLLSGIVHAQNKRFTTSGSIEFEKSVNMFAVIKKRITKDNEVFYKNLYEEYRRTRPQFQKLKSTLTFTNNQTLFVPGESNITGIFNDDPMVTQHTTVFADYNTGTKVSQKDVFEQRFLLKDSLRRIKWKITDERREIAGYSCRRANALVLDSIYVVAFYTDEIPVSGGPESFNGLPGMILGVALPHENVTWFATKVTDQPIQASAIKPPTKGKQSTEKEMVAVITEAVKDWGSYFSMAIKAFLL